MHRLVKIRRPVFQGKNFLALLLICARDLVWGDTISPANSNLSDDRPASIANRSIQGRVEAICCRHVLPPQQERHPRQARGPDETPLARRPAAAQGRMVGTVEFPDGAEAKAPAAVQFDLDEPMLARRAPFASPVGAAVMTITSPRTPSRLRWPHSNAHTAQGGEEVSWQSK